MRNFSTTRVSILALAALALAAAPFASAQNATGPALRGVVTDPSGASVPGATVQLRGPGAEQRKTADAAGLYVFPSLQSGKYQVRVIAKGFTVTERRDVEITAPVVFDVQLQIQADATVVNVEDETNKVSAEAENNGGALVLKEKELASLSDDPDELSQQLQAMAGPGAGPGGGQIYIDGFSGGQMPPKSSIREIRVNSNPFSAEYDRPGFGRIEILTRPGSDKLRGQVFFQYNDQHFNSRSPLLKSALPPYRQNFLGANLTGPVKKDKASFGLDFDRRDITENAFIIAKTLDPISLTPLDVNRAVTTPQTRTSINPRLDYTINPTNTLVTRYQFTQGSSEKQGIGDFSLESLANDNSTREHVIQATETAIINANMVNETRFQFIHSNSSTVAAGSDPALFVQGAFNSGSSTVGNSGTLLKSLELANTTTWTHGTHVIRGGFRIRESMLDSTSRSNFNGTFTFLPGAGRTALEVYQLTKQLLAQNLTPTQIRAQGGGASQFSIAAGTPTTSVNQFDIGLFFNDDWRLRPNFTLSYGVRYETQTNISDNSNFAPRIGIAWGVDSRAGRPGKTVIRAGLGAFFDRVGSQSTLSAQRFNGVTQQSYLILSPDFFPNLPTLSSLAAGQQPQRLQPLYSGINAPVVWQANAGVDRQVNKYMRLSVNYITSRGIHLQNVRNINTPINGIYPFGDRVIRNLTESAGLSRTNQLMVSPNVNYKKLTLFGFYSLSYGKSNNEGQPADPYNLSAEWGPSSFADVRHRAIVGTNVPLPWKVTLAPFMSVSSGAPYNITTGRDPYGVGSAAIRPALLANPAATCTGADLKYVPEWGCFSLNPAAGTSIQRNAARGPGNLSLNLRLARTWAFGRRGESSPQNQGFGGPGGPGGGGPPPGMGGGGMRGGPGGGGPPPGGGMGGMFGGAATGFKYNVTLSINANNAINKVNYSSPSGDLGSPYFGQYRSIAGGFGPMGGGNSTSNRKISLQLRFSF
ncbi:MAG: Cna domain protein [Bryobacterales bacterium]|nr:Cna domain protein [Bryobacterales bacterium]